VFNYVCQSGNNDLCTITERGGGLHCGDISCEIVDYGLDASHDSLSHSQQNMELMRWDRDLANGLRLAESKGRAKATESAVRIPGHSSNNVDVDDNIM
jgi:hypothetical protein